MPDISKCENLECILKERCYRFTSTPKEHWQAYGNFKYNEDTNSCMHFMDNEGYVKPVCDSCKGLTACSCEDTNPALP